MAADWPAFKDMNWLRLLEGPGDLTILPVAPTMKNITCKGERYFRMRDTRSTLRDGEGEKGFTGYGGAYLWDGYWTTLLRAQDEAATGLR